MQPGDTIDDIYIEYGAVIPLDNNKAFFLSVDLSKSPVVTVTACLVAMSGRQYATVLKIYYEGPWDKKRGFFDTLIQLLPVEDLPILAVHPDPNVQYRALRRLQDPQEKTP